MEAPGWIPGLALLAVAGSALLPVAVASSSGAPAVSAPASLREGVPFPTFSLQNLEGVPVRSDALPAVMLVNLWASWCAPCLVELPALDALHTRWQGRGAVVAVSIDTAQGPMLGVVRRLSLRMPVLWDPGGVWVAALAPSALPVSYLVVNGNILRLHAGFMSATALDAFVADVLP